MKFKELTVSASRTINLGNFNSLKVEGSATVVVDQNPLTDSARAAACAAARAAAIKEVKEQLEEAYKEFKPK